MYNLNGITTWSELGGNKNANMLAESHYHSDPFKDAAQNQMNSQ